jgi:hypothetical protein
LNYAHKIAQVSNLSLEEEIMLLDKVSKRKNITAAEIKKLKDKKID